ncbi:PC4-domain-containing protein [Obba rivulosa]|uniref:PC4-domain-containing protein n=1 Tax=Obba rivulosa TaxID=1052685 RepID=A0A8E2DJM8_9APHY|nr:PC4-domain-containing protein [Obba rivulosa]
MLRNVLTMRRSLAARSFARCEPLTVDRLVCSPHSCVPSRAQSTKTVASDVDDAGSSSEDAELAKKTDAASPEAGPSDAVLRVNQDGEKYLDLGNRRRATVRNFKGHVYLDIRKFFLDGDIEKPGQKGIMLSQDQWEAMKKGADTIDELFANVKK